jgi:Uma2 family endonuclease
MGAVPNPHWVTIEEFEQFVADQPDADQAEREFELFEGEILEVTFPVWKHIRLQQRIAALLSAAATSRGEVLIEVPFQISSTLRQVKRRADVAFVSSERSEGAMTTGRLEGAPELVVEVLSPSNTASRMYRLERLCMNNGCQEFWTVDLDDQSIRVVRGDKVTVYERPDSIPLPMFDADPIAIQRVFEGIVNPL